MRCSSDRSPFFSLCVYGGGRLQACAWHLHAFINHPPPPALPRPPNPTAAKQNRYGTNSTTVVKLAGKTAQSTALPFRGRNGGLRSQVSSNEASSTSYPDASYFERKEVCFCAKPTNTYFKSCYSSPETEKTTVVKILHLTGSCSVEELNPT